SQPSPPNISQPMTKAINEVVQEIRLFYQPPNAVTTAEEARVWIDRFKQTLADETSDPAELLAGWAEFRRGFTRGFWPIPGAVCQAIRDWRAAHRPAAGPKMDALPDLSRGRRWSELSPEEQAAHDERTRACLAELKRTTEATRMEADRPGP